ncbi:3-dehydroquinate synthase [cf. Phormidesmis sp. LEGE 11477]|uniref:3-dehydroquinate synthase n=1 Tax=cf. Phormidesmis sp. LEGE 11477 TaxID=1828680 RepID=UPI00187E0D9D|nr:3-dehydroquinate synthase [cf. Phormidesmis sp. LEGE 11477]MBE9060555.1 3-dehydroquinate synthase [cf. Phormidesmis sp. LEGE 11477]
MKTTIRVNIPQDAYDIRIAPGGLDYLGAWLAAGDGPLVKPGQKVLVVSNPVVFDLYGERAIASLTQAGYSVSHCILPAGEQYKNMASIAEIHDAAYENRLERSSAMIALGGGVIGDMTGFAASSWLRGISVVQVPTSLLAMVDASMGGKTGVNHPKGKNLIGAFHQPRLVLIDPQVLETLPVREFRAGVSEVIKYGVIWDQPLFEKLEAAERLDDYNKVSDELLQTMLIHSCQAKADVVSQDVKEAGIRAILNYGHTVGHAVESLTGYSRINHGEAVGIGMVAAAKIAEAVTESAWNQAATQRQQVLLEKTQLPTHLPKAIDIEEILIALRSDKKVKEGKVRFVLPERIGKAFVTDRVSDAKVRGVLKTIAA